MLDNAQYSPYLSIAGQPSTPVVRMATPDLASAASSSACAACTPTHHPYTQKWSELCARFNETYVNVSSDCLGYGR